MELKTLLEKNQFKFNKKFGQNFISDTNLLRAIVSDSNIGAEDTVVEIGAGAGTLTKELAAVAKKVIAFEIDQNLQGVLQENLAGLSNVEMVFSDVLSVAMQEIEQKAGGEFCVVANLPYYITTPIIMAFLENSSKVKSLTVMMQKEVADRLVAKPDTADYGSITVAVDFFGDAKIARKVGRNMFFPVPNVDSAVVHIQRVDKYDCDKKAMRNTVKAAFLMRRKTLVNNLSSFFALPKPQCVEILQEIGVDANARGETLDTATFVKLSQQITKAQKTKSKNN